MNNVIRDEQIESENEREEAARRDMFAAHALTGLLPNPQHWSYREVAVEAYRIADAMEKARNDEDGF